MLCGLLAFGGKEACAGEKKEKGDSIIILLDPGHGAPGSGAAAEYEEGVICEEEINLQIAEYVKEELETYKGVSVFLTRDGAYDVDLERRTMLGVEKGADALISLHNNAEGPFAPYDNGCTVLTARGQYRKGLATKGQELGVCILQELEAAGVENQGLLFRDSTNGEVYPNGETADYYAIIRNGMKHKLLSVIVEHAFLDSDSDYESFLSTKDKLRKLALADARGIAAYFKLKKADTGEGISRPENVRETVLYVKNEQVEDNESWETTFFVSEKEEGISEEAATSEEKAESKDVQGQRNEDSGEESEDAVKLPKAFLLLAAGVVLGLAVLCIAAYRGKKKRRKRRRRTKRNRE